MASSNRAGELCDLVARDAGHHTGKQHGVGLHASYAGIDHRRQGLVE
ncbi:hypothetical protein [Streptomyces sp. SID8374]